MRSRKPPSAAATKTVAFPWADVFRTAVLQFGVAPRDAWRLTLREIEMLMDAASPTTGSEMSRVRLCALMERFPDA